MISGMVVSLVEGLWHDGVRHTTAEVRALTGADEMLVTELGYTATPAEAATAVIAAATSRIGALHSPSLDDVRALVIGDRERLLLALYQLNIGSHIEAVAWCREESCNTAMELDLAIEDLIGSNPIGPAVPGNEMEQSADTSIPAYDSEARTSEPVRRIAIATDAGPWCVQCRLPNGADQEAAARMARSDPDAAADLILKRCVAGVTGVDGEAIPLVEASLTALHVPIAEAFLALDPLAEITLAMRCPACGAEITALFDAATFLLPRLARGDGILTEVHRLARAYHWSEAEILALPTARRRHYLGLLAAEGEVI